VSGNANSSPESTPADEPMPAEQPAPAEQTEPLACSIHAAPPPMERRSFLVWMAGIVLAIGGVFMGATVVQALVPPARSIDGKTKVGTVAVAKVSELLTGKPTTVAYGDDVLFIVKKTPTQIVVLSQTCPHVGCKLAFNDGTKQFDCPCHASHFTIDGVKLGGPAPRNMYGADFKIENNEVVVSGIQS
jgi:Rieske Fe-S protein